MSDVVRKRLMLLATASVLALAVFSWGSMAPAQDVSPEDATADFGDPGTDTAVGEADTDPAADGEVPAEDAWGGEFDNSPIDDTPIDDHMVDDGTYDETEVSDEGVVDEDLTDDQGFIDPEDGSIEDPGFFEVEIFDIGEPYFGPTAVDDAMMTHQFAPDVQRRIELAAPTQAGAPAAPAATLEVRAATDRAPPCEVARAARNCVTN